MDERALTWESINMAAPKKSATMKHRYTNESRKYRILHATKWSTGNSIEVPSRLIVIAFTPTYDHGNFAVRWQNRDGSTYGGGSSNTREAAHNMFLKKYLEHNESYRKGNPSHLPGIVK